jgi:ribA/ribD-fused uncharacterized protein
MIQETITNQKTIMFYRANGKYGFLSNLYKHPIEFEGREFPTSEHAYQFGKYRDKDTRDWVMKAPKPHLVAIVSHGLFAWDIVKNWSKIKKNRMYRILKVKFSDPDLKEKLIATGKSILIENSKTDSYWGIGPKGTGKNMLGKLLMKVREELKTNNVK